MRQENIEKKYEQLVFDESIKLLLSMSHKVLINFVNSAFKENFTEDKVEVTFYKINAPSDPFYNNSMISNWCIELLTGGKKYNYHISLQVKKDNKFESNMFNHALYIAKNNAMLSKEPQKFYFPKQLALIYGEDDTIQNEQTPKIAMPNNELYEYRISTLNCSQYTLKELIQNKLYLLLPLQLFNYNSKLESVLLNKLKNTEKELNLVLKELKDSAFQIMLEIKELCAAHDICDDDFNKMYLSLLNVFIFLNKKYVTN